MKLASLNDGTRDGKLVVVSKDLTRCCAGGIHRANDCRPRSTTGCGLRQSLKCWRATLSMRRCHASGFMSVRRTRRSRAHINGPMAAPISTTSSWCRKARDALKCLESFYHDPLMYQGGSDGFLPPRADIPLGDTAWGCDMEGEIAVVVDDVPMGVSVEDAASHIKLHHAGQRCEPARADPRRTRQGFRLLPVQARQRLFSPVAVTPDELGDAWKDSLVHLPLMVDYNGEAFGRAECRQVDATFNMAQLVAHAAKTRSLVAQARSSGQARSATRARMAVRASRSERRRPWLFLHRRNSHDRDIRDGEPSHPLHGSRRYGEGRDAGRLRTTRSSAAIEQTVVGV